jgi:drug/metabolite transporter (DMT)-like permease
MNLSPAKKAIIALVIANAVWGAASPIFKIALDNIPPLTLAFWRFFLGAFILLTVFGKRVTLGNKLFKNDAKLLVFSAVSGITVNIFFYLLGLQMTLAINAPVIASSGPLFTMFFAVLFLHEKFAIRKFVGMITGTIGIIVIILEPLLITGIDGSIMGNLFLLMATLGAVGQTILGRKILTKYDPLVITFYSFLIGALTFLPLAAIEYFYNPDIYAKLDLPGYFGLFYGAVFSSALAYALFDFGLSKVGATDVSMFSYIIPVVGTILGYFLLHEPITGPFVIGSILIIGAIFVSEAKFSQFLHHKISRRHKKPGVL